MALLWCPLIERLGEIEQRRNPGEGRRGTQTPRGRAEQARETATGLPLAKQRRHAHGVTYRTHSRRRRRSHCRVLPQMLGAFPFDARRHAQYQAANAPTTASSTRIVRKARLVLLSPIPSSVFFKPVPFLAPQSNGLSLRHRNQRAGAFRGRFLAGRRFICIDVPSSDAICAG